MVQPFLKWAGGKRQLLSQIEPFVPKLEDITYYEPFLGAGAMLFHFQPKTAIVNDINSELINVYKVIQDEALFIDLLNALEEHRTLHQEKGSEYFYEIRKWDRFENYQERTKIEKASRFIYLNKTCFNGLYRVNSKGQNNVPFGKYKKPEIVNETILREVHEYLNRNKEKVIFQNENYEEVVLNAKPGDFIYFDPPYAPLNKTSSFTSYAQEGFGENEQRKLGKVFKKLNDRGCKVLLSNSDTPLIKEIYKDFEKRIVTVKANRAINSKSSGRGKINEVLIVGDYYDFDQSYQEF